MKILITIFGVRGDVQPYLRWRRSLVAGTDHANLPVARPDAVADAVRRLLASRLA